MLLRKVDVDIPESVHQTTLESARSPDVVELLPWIGYWLQNFSLYKWQQET